MLQQGSIVVTGADGGLGSAIVRRILKHEDLATNYYGVYTVRNTANTKTVRRALAKAKSVKHSHELLSLDLASLECVRNTARDINTRVTNGTLPPIRVLILNAGWGEQITHSFTNDGLDMSFQVNYLSHFLLTLLLLQSMDRKHGRIVVLGSWTHDTNDPRNKEGPSAAMYTPRRYQQIFNHPMNTEDLAKGRWSSEREHPGDLNAGLRRYGAAKLCTIMMFRELSARIDKDPELSAISVVAVDPAPVAVWLRPNGTIRTTNKSAGDVLRAAFDTATLSEHPNGVYLNGSEIADIGAEAKDVQKSGQLWRDSIQYIQLTKGDTILKEWR